MIGLRNSVGMGYGVWVCMEVKIPKSLLKSDSEDPWVIKDESANIGLMKQLMKEIQRLRRWEREVKSGEC